MTGFDYRTAIGQDSHRFMTQVEWQAQPDRQLLLGGVVFAGETPLVGNSDADVILHALTNAVSGISGVNILGATADRMCREDGITDSSAYLAAAMASLSGWQIRHISLTIEGSRPRFAPMITAMKAKLSGLTGVGSDVIGLTATSGEGLTAFGRGEGLQVFCVVTARKVIDC